MTQFKEEKSDDDSAPKPFSFSVSWGLPFAILLAANIPGLGGTIAISLLLVSFIWLGVVNLLNGKKPAVENITF